MARRLTPSQSKALKRALKDHLGMMQSLRRSSNNNDNNNSRSEDVCWIPGVPEAKPDESWVIVPRVQAPVITQDFHVIDASVDDNASRGATVPASQDGFDADDDDHDDDDDFGFHGADHLARGGDDDDDDDGDDDDSRHHDGLLPGQGRSDTGAMAVPVMQRRGARSAAAVPATPGRRFGITMPIRGSMLRDILSSADTICMQSPRAA